MTYKKIIPFETEKLNEMAKKAYFDINTPDEEENIVLYIDNGEKISVLATLGNISLVNGKAKSRKTYFISSLVGTLLKNSTTNINITGSLPDNKRKIILFDTEQGKKDSKRVYKRILKIAKLDENLNNENLILYRLRQFTPAERAKIVEHVLYTTENIGFIVIDGIKDLISSINDEKESTEISSKLLKWTEELMIHILVILHQNKTDLNTRGHIGTELINKAETVISIRKDIVNKDISFVECDLMRSIDFDPFAIGIDDNDIPEVVIGPATSKNAKQEGSTKAERIINDIPLIDHYEKILEPVYESCNCYNYDILLNKIKTEFSKIESIGNNVVKLLIPYYVSNNLLIKQGREYKYNYEYNHASIKNIEIPF